MSATSSWSELPSRVRRRLRLAVFARDGYRCQLGLEGCTIAAEAADHIHDRATHGDGMDNLQAACNSCNLKKGKPSAQDPKHQPAQGAWW